MDDKQLFWTAVAEPPDNNYREIIESHMNNKKYYLEGHKMPFQERCTWIDF